MGFLNTTRWAYPSQIRLDFMQLAHIGFSSPHLIRRFRQANIGLGQQGKLCLAFYNILKQPVLVRFLGSLRGPDRAVEASAEPSAVRSSGISS